MRQRSAASAMRNGLIRAREGFRRVMSRSYHLPCPPHGQSVGKTFRPTRSVERPLVVADHLAGLYGVAIVEFSPAAVLGPAVFRLHPPGLECRFVLEADDVDLLPVFGREHFD